MVQVVDSGETSSTIESLGGNVVRNLNHLRDRRRRRVPKAAERSCSSLRLVIGGAAATLLLITIALIGLDAHSPAWAQSLPDGARGLFRFVTEFGKSAPLLVLSGVLGLLVTIADWRRAGRRMAAAWAEIGQLIGFFFFSLVGAGMTTNILKWSLGRSRPRRIDEDGIFAFSPISFDYAHVSFPSGHTTTAAAAFAACALIFRWRPGLVGVIAIFAGFIAISRIALRAHYPSDVAAGVLVGAAFTVFYAYALGRCGVAFQQQASGTLVPKTVAIRTVFRHRGPGSIVDGLRTALLDGWRPRVEGRGT